jgi:hypothetical protein
MSRLLRVIKISLGLFLTLLLLPSPGFSQTPISYGGTLSGSIDAPDEVDIYSFTATAGDKVVVRMAVTSGALDPEITLYKPDNITLPCSAYYPFGGTAEIASCALPETDTYTIRAGDSGNTDTGSYNLFLQRLNNPGNATPPPQRADCFRVD